MKPPLTALITLALCLPLTAQSETQALKQFRSAFAGDKRTSRTFKEKSEAIKALAKFDSAKTAQALIGAYADLEQEAEPIRAQRIKVLDRGGGSKLLLHTRLNLSPARHAQDNILTAIGRLKTPESVGSMVQSLIRQRRRIPLTLQIAIVRSAGKLAAKDVPLITKAAEKARKAEDASLFLAAIARLGKRAEAAAPWAVKMLEHDDVEVRVDAATALRELSWRKSINPLIERLNHEEERVHEHFQATLQHLTGHNPGPTALSWKMWIKNEGQPYINGNAKLGMGLPKPAKAPAPKPATKKGKKPPKKKPAKPEVPKGTGSYFGIPQDGQSILYVFDNSMSMRGGMPGQRKLPADQRLTKIQRCRQEMHKALNYLSPGKTFNVIAFANFLRRFSDKMMKATPANVAKAHEWIDSLDLELQTNIYDALELSFATAGRGARDRYYPVEADTIFFLSDGAPTRPKQLTQALKRSETAEILSAVSRWNVLQRVVVHTIGLGMGPARANQPANANRNNARDFLIELAKQNGGKFVTPN